jgi:GNAT superfamily N-acetyltransferase
MVTVREATAADADAIGRIHIETWRGAYRGLLPDDLLAALAVDERQRRWRETLSRERPPGSATFVAHERGEAVGFASVGAARAEADGVGELYAIYVHPTSWSTGAGRALIRRAEKSLRGSGFREAMLWVLEGNERGERFYRAAGWKPNGRKVDELQGVEVVELRYCKVL